MTEQSAENNRKGREIVSAPRGSARQNDSAGQSRDPDATPLVRSDGPDSALRDTLAVSIVEAMMRIEVKDVLRGLCPSEEDPDIHTVSAVFGFGQPPLSFRTGALCVPSRSGNF